MDIKAYSNHIDRLLVEISFTGAQYGLTQPVASLTTHLKNSEKTKPAAMLADGVLALAMKDYTRALTIFKTVQTTPEYNKFCEQAKSLESIVNQIKK